MIRHVVSGKTPPLNQHPVSQQVTYNYYTGCISVFSMDIISATEKLSFAYNNTPAKYYKNKRYLIIIIIV